MSYIFIIQGVTGEIWPFLLLSIFGLIWLLLLFYTSGNRELWAITNQRVFFFTKRKKKSWARSYYYNYQIKPDYIKVEPGKNGVGRLYFIQFYEREGITLKGFGEIEQVQAVKELLMQRLAQNSQDLIEDLPLNLRIIVKAELKEAENILWIDLANNERNDTAYFVTNLRAMEIVANKSKTEAVKSWFYSEKIDSTRVNVKLHESMLGDVSIVDNARRIALETRISFKNLVEPATVAHLIDAQLKVTSFRRSL